MARCLLSQMRYSCEPIRARPHGIMDAPRRSGGWRRATTPLRDTSFYFPLTVQIAAVSPYFAMQKANYQSIGEIRLSGEFSCSHHGPTSRIIADLHMI